MDITILVNKDNPLDKNYIPENLVEVSSPYYVSSFGDAKLEIVDFVYEAFKMLALDAQKAGFSLYIDSGYRSAEYQQQVLDYYLAQMGDDAYLKVALPGVSEHQLGLAVDIACFSNGVYVDEIRDEMPETMWLHEHCADYGFILRYPKGKEGITGYGYEPWHIRFVGLELAKTLYDNGKTLEEYYRNVVR